MKKTLFGLIFFVISISLFAQEKYLYGSFISNGHTLPYRYLEPQNIKANKKYHSPVSLGNEIKAIQLHLDRFKEQQNWEDSHEAILTFNNVLHYAEKKVEKIKGLERVYKERVNADELRGKYKDLEKFLTPQHYGLSTLKNNLNFSSSIFRHATRLTLTILIGFLLGKIFPLQNE